MSLFAELKRRNVFRVAAAYIVTAWLIVQVVETLFPIYGLSDAAVRLVINVLAIGLVPALVLAWVFEWTPEGLKKDADADHQRPASLQAAKRMDRMILLVLAVALGYFTVDKFVLDPARDAEELAAAMEKAREQGRTEAQEAVRDNSIAVLAFQDLSPDRNQEYFADGLAVDLMNQLGSVPDLRVSGKTSAFSFKGKDNTIPEIGEALNVAYVLDGSVSKVNDRVRISVALVDTRDDKQDWSYTYDRTLGDIFDVRDEITLSVYDRLTIEFERFMQESLRTDPEVYDLTLQASHSWDTSDAMRASDLIEQALEIDPDYLPALLLSIRINYKLLTHGLMSDDDAKRIAEERIERMLEIDPGYGGALVNVAWGDWEVRLDLESAARGFSQALRTAPGDLLLTQGAGMFARSIGRHEESIALLERCVAADPLNLICEFQLAQCYQWADRLEDALATYRKNQSTTGSKGNFYYLVMTLLKMGEPEEALIELEFAAEGHQDSSYFLAARAMVMHDLGRREESALALDKVTSQVTGQRRENAYAVAEAYAWIGDKDSAFEWLDKAYTHDKRFGVQGYWFQRLMFLPIWEKLHDDPRWDAFRERTGMSHSRLNQLEFSVPEWILLNDEFI